MNYEPVIGLEIHIELATKSKMFCSCSADYFNKEPNTHTCPVCLGLPGAMPVANELAIKYTHLIGLGLECQLSLSSKFDRKNYFYPDLAKGFQISQYDLPFTQKGSIEINLHGKSKKIGVTRAHLEEDTGKLLHSKVDDRPVTLIDFNRSGVPLIEIVSEPDMNSSEEAKAYAQKIQQIVRYIGASDADMEKGSMRIEPNVSLRKVSKGQGSSVKELPNYKVELKNINSFKFAAAAIEYEIKRQSELLDKGETPAQETRGWNESKNQTVSQRSKEEAHDYRYFPEPDLPPFVFNQDYLLKLKKELPELPDQKLKSFKDLDLSDYDAEILSRSKDLALYAMEAIKVGEKTGIAAKKIANEIINKKPDINNVLPAQLVAQIYQSAQSSDLSDDELTKAVEETLDENPKAVTDFKSGKENAIMFLTGQVMRKLRKKADSGRIKEILLKTINGN